MNVWRFLSHGLARDAGPDRHSAPLALPSEPQGPTGTSGDPRRVRPVATKRRAEVGCVKTGVLEACCQVLGSWHGYGNWWELAGL